MMTHAARLAEIEARVDTQARLDAIRLEQRAREQAALNSFPSAMVTSAGWQCPVCDRPGDQHDSRCFVKELADEAHRLRVANKRLAETNGRLRAELRRHQEALEVGRREPARTGEQTDG